MKLDFITPLFACVLFFLVMIITNNNNNNKRRRYHFRKAPPREKKKLLFKRKNQGIRMGKRKKEEALPPITQDSEVEEK